MKKQPSLAEAFQAEGREPVLRSARDVAAYFSRRGLLGDLTIGTGEPRLSAAEFRAVTNALSRKVILWTSIDADHTKRVAGLRKKRFARLNALRDEWRKEEPDRAALIGKPRSSRWGSYTSIAELCTFLRFPAQPKAADLAKRRRGGRATDYSVGRDLVQIDRAARLLHEAQESENALPPNRTPMKTVALLVWWFHLTRHVSPTSAARSYTSPVDFLAALVRAVKKRISQV